MENQYDLVRQLSMIHLNNDDINVLQKFYSNLKAFEISEILTKKIVNYKFGLKYGICRSDSIIHRSIVEDMKKENVTIEENDDEIPWDFTVVSCYLTDYVLK
jgi:hypothetical protein